MGNCVNCEYLVYRDLGHPRSPRRQRQYRCLMNTSKIVLQPEVGTCDRYREDTRTENGCTVRVDNER